MRCGLYFSMEYEFNNKYLGTFFFTKKNKHQAISLQTSSVKLYMSSNLELGGGGRRREGSL